MKWEWEWGRDMRGLRIEEKVLKKWKSKRNRIIVLLLVII